MIGTHFYFSCYCCIFAACEVIAVHVEVSPAALHVLQECMVMVHLY